MKKNEYTIAADANELLKERLETAVENKDRNFGNARYVRNIFEKAIQAQANRLSKSSGLSQRELTEITAEDLDRAFGVR